MSSFEEDFPSLATKETYEMFNNSSVVMKEVKKRVGIFVRISDVQEHCLDKQKVKEAIDKIYNSRPNASAEWMGFANELEKAMNKDNEVKSSKD